MNENVIYNLIDEIALEGEKGKTLFSSISGTIETKMNRI